MKRSLSIVTILMLLLVTASHAQVKQLKLKRVEEMADLPQPLKIIDWKALSFQFDRQVYDFNAKGEYWPLVWMENNQNNFKQPTMGMYTAIGDVRQGLQNHKGMFHEALANMGAVLSASLVGIDKSKQNGKNFPAMLKNYFNRDTKWNIMMNNTAPEVALLGGGYGRDWWYDVYPNLLFYAIYEKYPHEKDFTWMAKSIAEKFFKADSILNGNYNYSYFDYGKMMPMKNQICTQQDAAAGHAWILYAAYKKFGDPRYLKGAISAMTALESNQINPTYELLMPFGAYLAARMNVEQGTKFDVQKLLEWTFDGTAVCREGWGVLTGKWNGYDISGIVGSTVDHGGYGFLMNTFDAAWPLVPLVKYKPHYAHAIGKWMLNAVNASRLFYPQYMPKANQTIPQLAEVTKGVIAYEGIAKSSTFDSLYMNLKAPVAQGDGPKWVPGKNPAVSQFSVYGSAHVGIFGAIVAKTNVDGILKLDVLATDFYRGRSFPTYLLYNPYLQAKRVNYQITSKTAVDLYDAVAQKIVAKNVRSSTSIAIPKNAAVLIVEVTGGTKLVKKGSTLVANKIIIDYNYYK